MFQYSISKCCDLLLKTTFVFLAINFIYNELISNFDLKAQGNYLNASGNGILLLNPYPSALELRTNCDKKVYILQESE